VTCSTVARCRVYGPCWGTFGAAAYRPQIVEGGEQKQAFVWGFNSVFSLAALLEFGHDQPVLLDSIFGTNQYMVFPSALLPVVLLLCRTFRPHLRCRSFRFSP
jgi:hypothetical protein